MSESTIQGVDIAITGGSIVDGTGRPGFLGTVCVTDGRLLVIDADRPVIAARTIEAGGKVVVPGFIDLHSHSGLHLLAEPGHEAKLEQGVTTEVIGIDGNSYAPFMNKDDLRLFARMYAGLDGYPEIDYDWDTVESYLGRFDRRAGVNVAMLVGNSALRLAAIGWDRRDATDPAIESMRSMLREAMEEGAFGISSGLDYPPGSYASTGELTDLASEAAARGGIYHTHVRYQLGDRYLDPFREALDIGRGGACPVHITHFYRRNTYPAGAAPLLQLVDDAVDVGMDVTFDAYPYPASSTTLLILVPQWALEGGPDQILERLSDDKIRSRIRADIDSRVATYGGDKSWEAIRLGGFRRSDLLRFEARTIAEIAEVMQVAPAEAICDLLVAEDLQVNQVATTQDPDTIPEFLAHPRAMVGTDSVFIGAKPSPRTFGSFPKILGDFVRAQGRFTLEDAVHKMTLLAAKRIGLADRGVIRDGAIADLVVMDPDTVSSPATIDDPRRRPIGIDFVLVGGAVAVEHGRATGALNGRALRPGRADR